MASIQERYFAYISILSANFLAKIEQMNASLAANLLYFPATRLAGERIREYLDEYRSNDRITPNALRHKQQAALRRIIRHASQSTDYYRNAFNHPSSVAPPTAFEELAGIVPIEKSLIRESPEAFISSRAPRRREHKTTSGSTGQPLTIVKNRDALARERAATWRAYEWAGVSVAAAQGLLWGVPHSTAGRIRTTLRDFVANRKRLSMFGVTEAKLAVFHRQLVSFQPVYLYGYVSALIEFMRFLQDTRRTLPQSVRCLISTAELLDDSSRTFLERASGVKVFNEYGCGEVGSIGHECEHGRMHVMGDNLVIECLPSAGLPEGLGELVVTDLHNMAMPLIRYRTGDLGSIADTPCKCGRPYLILDRVVGRAYDTITGSSGKSYHPESVLYVFEDLRRSGFSVPPFQAIQRRNGDLEIYFQTDASGLERLKTTAQARLEKSFEHDLSVQLFQVDKLTREPSGKFRVVKRE